jgi:hypothetical protein
VKEEEGEDRESLLKRRAWPKSRPGMCRKKKVKIEKALFTVIIP